eukprot:23921-Eustigmatos_ZCMA.PRE.1
MSGTIPGSQHCVTVMRFSVNVPATTQESTDTTDSQSFNLQLRQMPSACLSISTLRGLTAEREGWTC